MDVDMDTNKMKYIMVTPVKNEEDSLPKLVKSVLEQTIKPSLWVIVDDGSTDKTVDIIGNLTNKCNWIEAIRVEGGQRDLGVHISHVCREGFNFAIKYCTQQDIGYKYIALVDADIILKPEYFEKLMREFEKNQNLGVASGRGANIIGNRIVEDKQRDDLPSGGARLWRKRCFEDTGGYLLTKSPDSVSNVKAIIKGWDTKQFHHVKFVSTRAHASAEGYWRGYNQFGSNNYFIGYTPIHALLKGVKLLLEKPYYTGFAYLWGYFSSLICRKKRIDDEEVKYYFRHIRLREIRRYYVNRLMNIFRIKTGDCDEILKPQ
jgi:glycosyltransferase involved in cell wall biosynthesis